MIEGIEFANFKAFARLELPLARLTLLSGLNSAGKSSVLQALALLRQSYLAGVLDRDDGRGGFLLNGTLVELGGGRDVLHANWQRSPGRDTEHVSLGVRSGGHHHGWTVGYSPDANLLPLRSAPTGLRDDIPLFAPRFQYLRADRISPSTLYPRSHEAAIDQEFLGARGEHTVNYLRHFQDAQVTDTRLHHPESPSNSLLRQTEAWLGEFCPGVSLEAVGVEGTDQVRLSYAFGGWSGLSSGRYRPTNVGFGLTYTLPIVVACLTARPGSLILLENPEAHLHPRGQSQIAALIARAVAVGAQAVVESHSDHVLNGFRIAVKRGVLRADQMQPHYFRRDGTDVEVVSPKVDRSGMLAEWPEGFFDEWDNALEDLLDE